MVLPHEPANALDFDALARDGMEPSAYDYSPARPEELAADGEARVRVLEMVHSELEPAMAPGGCLALASITRSFVRTRKG